MADTELEIQSLWRQLAGQAGFAVRYEPAAVALADELATEARETISTRFQAFLGRFDFALEWLTSLWLSMDRHWQSDDAQADLMPVLMLTTKTVRNSRGASASRDGVGNSCSSSS